MPKLVYLFKNKWVSVKELTLENGGDYIFSHSSWCNGEGIAILPFRRGTTLSFLGRFEVCPAHSLETELCSITGGHDKPDESFEECAIRELLEEAGYIAEAKNLINLGTVRPSKSSDSKTHLFAIDVTDCERIEAIGDGSLGEEGAYCDWITKTEIVFSKDPLLLAMLLRLDNNIELQ